MRTIDETASTTDVAIEGIAQPVVLRYFERFNAGEFEAIAGFFAKDGQLHAPFEEPIEGQRAIAVYLQAEARGMQLYPHQGTFHVSDNGHTQVEVAGKVQTPWFGVNVAWLFVLNARDEILAVTVKLLASPQELFSLRPLTNH